MPVTKTTRECYEVREGKPCGEWANITLHCWERTANRWPRARPAAATT
jgi:hypothetical protein